MTPHREQFIYCASDGDLVKVGSTCHPRSRLLALRRSTGRDFQFVRVWCIGRQRRAIGFILEGRIHSGLSRYVVSGREWYRGEIDALVAVIRKAIIDLCLAWRVVVTS